jgi:hypothetical protein
MTDRENFSGGFLERWSRRKIEAERQAPDVAREQDATKAPVENAGDKAPASASQELANDAPAQVRPSDKTSATPDLKPNPDTKFDIASLPSLDSITAASDVRAFLSPGVPAELTRAALRRAWAADPAIRDFKGLAENDWDFTDPNAMAGFGDLPADFDVRKLVAQIFGESDEAKEPKAAEPEPAPAASVQQSDPPREIASDTDAEPAEAEGEALAETAGSETDAAPATDLVHRSSNAAMHNSISPPEEDETKTRRTHGRALPQ